VVEEHDAQPVTEEVHHTVYSVANLITIMRLLLVPFFFTVLVDADSERGRITAFFIYAIAASTDWIDGQIARRTHTVTQFGKIVDPLVDRLLLASGVVGLYLIDVLPLWVPIVLLGRDAYLLYGAYTLERYKVILPVTYVGKLTTAVLFTGFASLIAGWPEVPGIGLVQTSWLPGLGSASAPLGIWFVYVGVVLSLSAAVQYTLIAVRARNAAIEAERG
jgi:cardiolipin synthase